MRLIYAEYNPQAILGYDLTIKSERDRYIDILVELLFVGVQGRLEGRM